MTAFLDAYSSALKEFDLNAYVLYATLQMQIADSAEQLLHALDVKALQPAVHSSLAGGALESKCHSENKAASRQHPQQPQNENEKNLTDDGQHHPLLASADVSALCSSVSAAATGSAAGITTLTMKQRLVKELTALAQMHAHDNTAATSSADLVTTFTRTSALSTSVFVELSPFSRSVLALTALWMCTKFWGTISESSTLSGLISCLVRHGQGSSRQAASLFSGQGTEKDAEMRTTAVADEHYPATNHVNIMDGNVIASALLNSVTHFASPPTAVATAAVVTAIEVTSAFTPPPSPRLVPAEGTTAATTKAAKTAEPSPAFVSCSASNAHAMAHTPTNENVAAYGGESVCKADAHEGGGGFTGEPICEPLQCPLQPPVSTWHDVAYDRVDELALNVEHAEMMLLRCSDYAIPV